MRLPRWAQRAQKAPHHHNKRAQPSAPHQVPTPTKLELQIPNKDIFQAISLAPQQPSLCRHSHCLRLGLSPQRKAVWAADQLHSPPPAVGVLPAPLAALWAPGPVNPCVSTCACVHTHMCKRDFLESREQQEVLLL